MPGPPPIAFQRPGRRVFLFLPALLSASLARPAEDPSARPAAPEVLVSFRDSTGKEFGLLSAFHRGLAFSRLLEKSRTLFVSPGGRRLNAWSWKPGREKDIAILESEGGAGRLAVLADSSLVDAGLHVPTVLSLRPFDEEKLFFFSRPRGNPDAVRKQFAALRKTTSRWLKAEDPVFFGLLREAHELHGYLWGTSELTPNLPKDYWFVSAELAALMDLFDAPSTAIEKPILAARLLPEGEAAKLLSERVKPEPPKVPESRRISGWAGRLLGGKDEKLGEILLESSEPPFAQAIRLEWRNGTAPAEQLTLVRGEFGDVRISFERVKDRRPLPVLVLENIAGGSGEMWYDPYVVEDGLGIRAPFELSPSGDDEREKGRRAILDASLSALYRSGCQEPCASELLWRWLRILEIAEIPARFPEIQNILAILSKAPPPSFEKETDKAWLGSVSVARDVADGSAGRKQ